MRIRNNAEISFDEAKQLLASRCGRETLPKASSHASVAAQTAYRLRAVQAEATAVTRGRADRVRGVWRVLPIRQADSIYAYDCYDAI